ncbi:ferredoxin reductase family protein [Cryobacterium sp. PH31-O1]|uniref:ferredoxin reductase family protein n=1 Tax=Cryobacterium sp. PH31-O1 TaxID=3046306 RepID=UPI0024BBD9C9|nr:ferredoxin reductase family protein [Cryobacterium sp. PH31-O1]MDJ0337685.1 ferredoxin reductase family protein [Cryobacterium sp. PH31-O1]
MSLDTRTTRSGPVPTPRTRAALPHPAYGKRMRLADSLQILCVASVAIVIAIFLADGGAARFGTPADAFTSLGIVAGLVGTDLLLVMLVLAARLPPIDRAFGHDQAMAVHQSLGKPALYLILGHAVLLITGYALAENVNVFVEVWNMFTSLPDMPLAFLGLALMIGVVVTSLLVVRRKFRYEAWHAVHLLAYLSVLVAIPHQLSVGGLLSEGAIARYYWLALYAAVAAAIVVFRFVLPVVRSLRHQLRVDSIEQVAPGVVSISLVGRRLDLLGASSGQFFIWRFWSAGLWWQAHPFSLSAAPNGRSLRITVRGLGDASAELPRVPRGTRVSFEGPYGLFTESARTSPRVVLIAAGIGVAPIRSLLETVSFAPGTATVLLRSHSLGDTYLVDELTDLCWVRGAELRIIAGERPTGVNTWLPADASRAGITLSKIVPDLLYSDIYICGPRPWTDAVVRDARAGGVPKKQIHYERFDW